MAFLFCVGASVTNHTCRWNYLTGASFGNKTTWLVNSISLYLRDLLGLITRKEAVPRKLCRKALKPGSNAHLVSLQWECDKDLCNVTFQVCRYKYIHGHRLSPFVMPVKIACIDFNAVSIYASVVLLKCLYMCVLCICTYHYGVTESSSHGTVLYSRVSVHAASHYFSL